MEDKELNLDNKEIVPVGILVMMMKKAEEANNKLFRICIALALCWLVTIGGFLWYLSIYEVHVDNYGGFDNSKVNTSNGQFNDKVDTFVVNNGVDLTGKDKK